MLLLPADTVRVRLQIAKGLASSQLPPRVARESSTSSLTFFDLVARSRPHEQTVRARDANRSCIALVVNAAYFLSVQCSIVGFSPRLVLCRTKPTSKARSSRSALPRPRCWHGGHVAGARSTAFFAYCLSGCVPHAGATQPTPHAASSPRCNLAMPPMDRGLA